MFGSALFVWCRFHLNKKILISSFSKVPVLLRQTIVFLKVRITLPVFEVTGCKSVMLLWHRNKNNRKSLPVHSTPFPPQCLTAFVRRPKAVSWLPPLSHFKINNVLSPKIWLAVLSDGKYAWKKKYKEKSFRRFCSENYEVYGPSENWA